MGAPAIQLSIASSLLFYQAAGELPSSSLTLVTYQGQPESDSQGRWHLVHLVIYVSILYPSIPGHHV